MGHHFVGVYFHVNPPFSDEPKDPIWRSPCPRRATRSSKSQKAKANFATPVLWRCRLILIRDVMMIDHRFLGKKLFQTYPDVLFCGCTSVRQCWGTYGAHLGLVGNVLNIINTTQGVATKVSDFSFHGVNPRQIWICQDLASSQGIQRLASLPIALGSRIRGSGKPTVGSTGRVCYIQSSNLSPTWKHHHRNPKKNTCWKKLEQTLNHFIPSPFFWP